MALFRIGCFLFTILTIESPRAFLSQRNCFESIDFIFCFNSTGESAFRWGAELGMSRVLLSELVRGTDHGGTCLPVLERKQCECLKSPSNSHRLLYPCFAENILEIFNIKLNAFHCFYIYLYRNKFYYLLSLSDKPSLRYHQYTQWINHLNLMLQA